MPYNDIPVRGTTPKVVHTETSVLPPTPSEAEVPVVVPPSQPEPSKPQASNDPVDALFSSLPNPETAIVAEEKPKPNLSRLIPIVDINLTDSEKNEISIFIEARAVLGPASAAILVCSEACPFRTRCPLYIIHKAPFGSRCPFEASYATDRFGCWMKDLGVTEGTITETERVAISSLVVLDLQELRLLNILSSADRAHLTSRVVRDVDIETGVALAYEEIVAPELIARRDLHEQRTRILNDFNLTPAAKAKAARALALRKGADMASRQSAAADLIRGQQPTITVEAIPAK